MQSTKTLTAALAAAAAWLTPGALAQADHATEAGRAIAILSGLIDPPAPGASQDDRPSRDEMKRVVRELIESGEGERIRVFGESAGPALRAIVAEADLKWLTRDDRNNPLYYLVTYAPAEALQYFVEIEAEQRFRYEAIVRGAYGPQKIARRSARDSASRDVYLQLLDRTIALESLSLSARVDLAAEALDEGLKTEKSEALIRQNPGLAMDEHGRSVRNLIVPKGTTPPADLDPAVARDLAYRRPSIEVFEGLADSPDRDVRRAVADSIGDNWQDARLPVDRALEILSKLIEDEDAVVVQRALSSTTSVLREDSFRLDIELLTRLTAQIANKSQVEDSLCNHLAGTIHRTAELEVDGDPADIGRLYGAAFGAPNPRLHRTLMQYAYPRLSMDRAIAFYAAAAPSSKRARESVRSVLVGSMRSLDALSPERASAFLAAISSDAMTAEDVDWLTGQVTHESGNMDSVHNGHPPRRMALAALPAPDVPAAVRVVAAVDGRFDEIGFTSCVRWTEAGAELRAILVDPTASPRERLFAGGAMAMNGSATDADVEAFRDLVVSLLGQPGGREHLAWYFENRGAGSEARSSRVWNRVSAALLESERFPDALADDLSLIGDAETAEERDVARRVLVAAERRVVNNPSLQFRNLTYFGLDAMIADPALLQPTLLRAWLAGSSDFISKAVTVVLATNDPEWIRYATDALLARMAAQTFIGRQRPIADQILRLPGDEPVQRLLEQVTRTGSPDLVTHVEKRVAELLRIREASLRWSRLASGGGDVDGAKARVLALLDSQNEEVRIEAIKGLGTLGAVEALPRLIEVVGSGSAAEKAAAKETLEMLRRRAAMQLDRTEAGRQGN